MMTILYELSTLNFLFKPFVLFMRVCPVQDRDDAFSTYPKNAATRLLDLYKFRFAFSTRCAHIS